MLSKFSSRTTATRLMMAKSKSVMYDHCVHHYSQFFTCLPSRSGWAGPWDRQPEISIMLRITRLQSFRVSFPMCKNKYEIHSSQGPKRHVHKLIVVRHCYVEEIILICIFHSFDHIKTIHQIYTYIDHHHHSCLTLLRQGLLPCPRAIFICALW